MEYIDIPILEAARRCNIELKQSTLTRNEVEGYCPFCKSVHAHLHLNVAKNRWHCKKCGAGGNSVMLYARVYGIENKQAFEELTQDGVFRINTDKNRPKCDPKSELAPLERRHDVYYDLLTKLSLNDRHKGDLLRRGLSEERIGENMYRSMPTDWRTRRDIATSLAKIHNLQGVPGFFTKRDEPSLWGKGGYLIPILTKDGYIQGMQIRLDDTSKGKYRWLSSNPEYHNQNGEQVFENGTRAYSWVHITGDTTKSTVCITEGGLKGDIASFLRNEALFACIPGVNGTEYLTDTLKELSAEKIFLAYDMDCINNLEVANALRKLQQKLCKDLKIPCEPIYWNPMYKGIDDYSLYLKQKSA